MDGVVCRIRRPDTECRSQTASRSAPTATCGFPKLTPDRSDCITPDGKITEFKNGITPGSKPLSIVVRDGDLWFSEAAGNRIARITVDGEVTEYSIPGAEPQPRAMVTHPDGAIWFVETGANALGRFTRRPHLQRVQISDAERLAARGDRRTGRTSLVYRKLRQQDRSHGRRTALCSASTPFQLAASGARCIASLSNGRLYFTQYDAGSIGEIILD